MATRAQKTKVGVFIVGCAILAIAGVFLIEGFTRGDYAYYTVHFAESVQGLQIGSTVTYMGVPVGRVKTITVVPLNESTRQYLPPSRNANSTMPPASHLARVTIEVSRDTVTLHEGVEAQLVMISVATGSLGVSLEGGAPENKPLADYDVIPAVPSLLTTLSDQIKSLLLSADTITGFIRKGLSDMEDGELTRVIRRADGLLEETTRTVADARTALNQVRERVEPSLDSFNVLVDDMRETVNNINGFVSDVRAKMEPIDPERFNENINKVFEDVSQLALRLQGVADSLDAAAHSILYDADNMEFRLRETLVTINETLSALNQLVSYLQDDPSALVRGRGRARGD